MKGEAPLAKDAVRIIRACLHAMLETAVEDGIVAVNVAHLKAKRNSSTQRRVRGEKQIRIRQKVFTREQLMLFLKTAWEHAQDYFVIFFLLARAGLRIGEALALKVGDLDFVERLINVEPTIVRGEVGPPKHGLTRQVDMSAQLAKVLGEVVLDRKEELLQLGMSADELPNLWLFQNTVGKPMDDSKVRKVFAKLPGTAKPPFPAPYLRVAAVTTGGVPQVRSGTARAQLHQNDMRHLWTFGSGRQPPGRGSAGRWKQNGNILDPRAY